MKFPLALLVLVPTILHAQEDRKEKAKKFAQATPVFVQYVATEAKPPQFSVSREFGIRSCVYFDAALREVKEFKEPGIYGAIFEVTGEGFEPSKRLVTLYRTRDAIPAETRGVLDLAGNFGLDPAQVQRHQNLLDDVLKARPFSEWSRDPRAAQLLAGISLCRTKGPLHKYHDAFAEERQWWVNLKRKHYRWAEEFPKPLSLPAVIEGDPSPQIREGTLAEAGMKPDAADKIDAVLKEWAADTDQAFAVCVVRKGVIVLHRAYGTRDGKPMTVDTKSWMASVTKAMSATLMYQLIDAGIVSLDDDVGKFFPALRKTKVEKPLLIRHLYTHTGDLAEWPGWSDDMHDVDARLGDYYPLLKVGDKWAYGGTGNILGGKIVEAVSGECVPKFFHEHLLEPLGCANTDVSGTHADTFSTPLDMAKFGQMLLQKGTYGKYCFFSEKTFEKMLPRKLTAELGPETTKTFGVGLDGTARKFGHGAASAATFSVDMESQLVVVVTRNKIGTNYDKYNGKFWDAIKNGITE